MHDIRKPYTRSSSNQNLQSRVEQFEARSYERDGYEDQGRENRVRIEENGPVQIPFKRVRRNLDAMEMYPPRRRMDDIREGDKEKEYEEEKYDRRRPENGGHNQSTRRVHKENSLGTLVFIIAIIVLAGGAGLLTYVFDSATVTIVPKYKDIDVNKTVTFTQKSTTTTSVPFIVTTTRLTKSKTLPLSESKKVESKASGKVIIYNNYDGASQKLIKNTRLESTTGKIYRINESVTVPGKVGSTPGSVEVTVYADSYGAGYNSVLTDFSIPGFKGTPREKSFYGRSKTPMTGGSSGNVSLASLSDMNAAKDEFALELAQEIKVELLKINKEGYIGLYGASEIIYKDNEEAILNGTTGVYEVTGTGYIILADSAKLAQSVAQGLLDYSNEPVRLDYTDTLLYTRKDTDHIASSTDIAILIQGKPRVIWLSDFDAIKEAVRGKKRDDFKPIMKKLTTIVGAEIGFSPLWLSTFPNDITKISIVESLPKR